MDIIEIINELRKHYLNNNNEVLVISVNTDGFTVNRKSRYQQRVEPVKAQPIDRSRSRHRVPTGEEVLSAGHTSKWWSRYHLEKNLLTIAFHQLQAASPYETWFVSGNVANVMSQILGLTVGTCKRHITRAIKLGIIVKRVEGNVTSIALNNPENIKEGGEDNNIFGDKEEDTTDEHEKILP